MSQSEENLVDRRNSAAVTPPAMTSQLAASSDRQFTMKDGTEVTLRPIHLADEPLMAQFHQALSGRSVYMRYFCSLSLQSRVAHDRLVRICHVDGEREVALVVTTQIKGLGSRRYWGWAD